MSFLNDVESTQEFELELTDLGDTSAETMQFAAIPRAPDCQYGLGYYAGC